MMIKMGMASREQYDPYGACHEVLFAEDPEVLISGPAGTGKSVACLFKLYAIAQSQKVAGVRLLICRKTRASCTESILVSFEQMVAQPNDPILRGPHRMNRHVYTFENGSEIVVGGLDNPNRILSTEFDLVYVAEALELTLDDWEKLASRLRHNVLPYQQLLGDTNPGAPSHWLKARCDMGVCRLLRSRHSDNPMLYDHEAREWTDQGKEYIGRLGTLTGVRRERLLKGLWVAAEGAVYDMFDPAVHVVDRFHIPAHWRRLRAVDFGYTNPFVCLWIALDPDGRMFVYRYIYYTKRLVSEHAELIKELTHREPIEATICDHDAEDAATLQNAGILTTLARKEIRIGIDAVTARLIPAGDGRPRLFILRDSLVEADPDLIDRHAWTIEHEFESYSWPRGASGKPTKEVPIDDHNHALDALRYAVRYVDQIHGGDMDWLKRFGHETATSRRKMMRAH
jgi:PBSX family phage terminase large subunit